MRPNAGRLQAGLRVAAIGLALLLSARHAPAEVVDLASLQPADGLLRIYGSSGNGSLGVPVAGGFDCDGDGAADVAHSAMLADPLGRENAGEIYLTFGDGAIGGTVDTAVAQQRVLRILGAAESEHAGSEIWMDDVTGDGLGDLLIARQDHTPGPERIGAGALSILVGAAALRDHAATLGALDLAAPPDGVTVTTLIGVHAYARLGIWMRTGDVTGDEIADIIVGSDQESYGDESHRGAVYLIRGGEHLASGASIDLADFGTTSLAGHLARIAAPEGSLDFHFGATCQIADLDGNGYGEVLIAAALLRAGASLRAKDALGGTSHSSGGSVDGTLYIAWDDNFPAGAWPAGYGFDISASPGARTIIDGAQGDNITFGEEILGGLDYDDDGMPDLFVGDLAGDGTPDNSRFQSGIGHVFYRAAELRDLEFDLAAPPAEIPITTLLGPSFNAIAADTALHGDFDADGIADLAVGTPHGQPMGRHHAGIVHVFHGRTGGWPALVDLALPPPDPELLKLTEVWGANGSNGSDGGDTLAYSAAAGDIDGDDVMDLILNEMQGNGVAPNSQDVGNLIVLSGAVIVPEPAAFALGLAALSSLGALAHRSGNKRNAAASSSWP